MRFGSLERGRKFGKLKLGQRTNWSQPKFYTCGMIRRLVKRGQMIVSLLCLRGSKMKINEETRAFIASSKILMKRRHPLLEARAEYWR